MSASVDAFDAGPAVCRLLLDGDRTLYHALHGNAAVMAGIGPVLDAEQADRGFANALAHNRRPLPQARARFWRIVDAASGEAAGLLALVRAPAAPAQAELGVMLLPAWQRRGLASASLAGLIALLRSAADADVRATVFTARTAEDNRAAAALFSRLGFVACASDPPQAAAQPDDAAALRLCHWRLQTDR